MPEARSLIDLLVVHWLEKKDLVFEGEESVLR
jgi:hypothetical protein